MMIQICKLIIATFMLNRIDIPNFVTLFYVIAKKKADVFAHADQFASTFDAIPYILL